MIEDINQIKKAIDFIVEVIQKIKLVKKPLLGVVLSLGKLKGFKIKEVKAEIKDLSPEEKSEIVRYVVSKGFSEQKGLAVIKDFESGKKTTIFSLIRIFQ